MYTFICDDSHAWLSVPTKDLFELGPKVYEAVSGFSYLSRDGHTTYLEEDCDAGLFLRASGITSYRSRLIDGRWEGRDNPPYDSNYVKTYGDWLALRS